MSRVCVMRFVTNISYKPDPLYFHERASGLLAPDAPSPGDLWLHFLHFVPLIAFCATPENSSSPTIFALPAGMGSWI